MPFNVNDCLCFINSKFELFMSQTIKQKLKLEMPGAHPNENWQLAFNDFQVFDEFLWHFIALKLIQCKTH